MKTCYCCSSKATHEIYADWKPVCDFHYDEALEEETKGILVKRIDPWEVQVSDRQAS